MVEISHAAEHYSNVLSSSFCDFSSLPLIPQGNQLLLSPYAFPGLYFGTSVDTQQWAQPVTAGVHGVSSKKCRLEVVE